MLLTKLLYLSAPVLPGLDHRFGWSRAFCGPVPAWLTVLALLDMPACHAWFFPVFKASRFAAAIIRVESGQTLTTTGPYRFIPLVW